jgi:hypothetical protein
VRMRIGAMLMNHKFANWPTIMMVYHLSHV